MTEYKAEHQQPCSMAPVLQMDVCRFSVGCLQLACHHNTADLATEYKAGHAKVRTTHLSCCGSAECSMPGIALKLSYVFRFGRVCLACMWGINTIHDLLCWC